MSNKGFVELQDTAALDSFLKAADKAVVLFKHSNSCGISAQAFREMAKLNDPVGMITVQQARDLSAEIERRFGLPHETPQVLIVRKDELLWNASHSQVRAHVVESALSKVGSEP